MEYEELEEAIAAADAALKSLDEAYDTLNGARKWGVFDMIAGGFFSSLAKRRFMKDAQYHMDEARDALVRLEDELDDIDEMTDLYLGDDFFALADLFLDNFVFDWIMQDRINDALDKIDETAEAVQQLREKLVAQTGNRCI